MEKIKEIIAVIFGSKLLVEGTGRTYVKVPMWLVVLAAGNSIVLSVVTALLIVAFGMHVKVEKA